MINCTGTNIHIDAGTSMNFHTVFWYQNMNFHLIPVQLRYIGTNYYYKIVYSGTFCSATISVFLYRDKYRYNCPSIGFCPGTHPWPNLFKVQPFFYQHIIPKNGRKEFLTEFSRSVHIEIPIFFRSWHKATCQIIFSCENVIFASNSILCLRHMLWSGHVHVISEMVLRCVENVWGWEPRNHVLMDIIMIMHQYQYVDIGITIAATLKCPCNCALSIYFMAFILILLFTLLLHAFVLDS